MKLRIRTYPALFAGPCDECNFTIEPGDQVVLTESGHHHKECPQGPPLPVTVNDRDQPPWITCWICGAKGNHATVPHGIAVGDGVTRAKVVALMNQGGYQWRPEE